MAESATGDRAIAALAAAVLGGGSTIWAWTRALDRLGHGDVDNAAAHALVGLAATSGAALMLRWWSDARLAYALVMTTWAALLVYLFTRCYADEVLAMLGITALAAGTWWFTDRRLAAPAAKPPARGPVA